MADNDLTRLAAVKAWATINGVSASDGDDVYGDMITQASMAIFGVINRSSVIPRTFAERYDGNGRDRMQLRNWPVLSIASLSVNGAAYVATSWPASGNPGTGYILDAWDGAPPGNMQNLDAWGFAFLNGRNNISINYSAGYKVTAELHVIPANGQAVAINKPYGQWATDEGVTTALGAALLKVIGTPAAGQYAVGTTRGTYVFAAADSGNSVLISYGYIPAALEMACVQLVGENIKYRNRIGQTSMSQGGQETAAFDNSRMTAFVKGSIMPYARVAQF